MWDADAHVPERGGHSVCGSCGSSSSRVAVRVAHTDIRNVVAAWVGAVDTSRESNLDLRQRLLKSRMRPDGVGARSASLMSA